METVVLVIMMLVAVSFVLKLSCHSMAGIMALSLVAALFTAFGVDFASQQSKTLIADWLADPALMLDIAVVLTIDVFLQTVFCILYAQKATDPLSQRQEIALGITGWVPGLLIFPVLLALLVELVFSLPGVDFGLIGWSTAACVAILFPAAALGIRYILPEAELRAELIFLINLLIAALGIVATVNGRTAAAGTNEVEFGACVCVIALLAAGSCTGIILYRYMNKRKISKLL